MSKKDNTTDDQAIYESLLKKRKGWKKPETVVEETVVEETVVEDVDVERALQELMEDADREIETMEGYKSILKSGQTAPPTPEVVEENRTDTMNRYSTALKNTPSAPPVVVEQDLQNTPATMKELKNLELSVRNIQTSLTSLGGGGLGEEDVIKIAQFYGSGIGSIALDDMTDVTTIGATTDDVLIYNGSEWSPGPQSAGGAGGVDSAGVVTIVTSTVDSAYVNALVTSGAAGVDSAGTIALITETVDSAYVNALVDTDSFLDESEVVAIVDSATADFLTSSQIDSVVGDFLTDTEITALVDSATADFLTAAEIQADIDSATAPFLIQTEVDARVTLGVNAHVSALNHHDSNQIRNFITPAHINPMIDTYVDSAYLINHMQWLDSTIENVINIHVDSAYVGEHCHIPLNQLTNVSAPSASTSVDDVLVYDGTNWVNRPIPTPNPSLLDYQGVVDPTVVNSGPDISDVSELPFHGDIYVASVGGIVDSSWAGLDGTTVLVQDVLLFDSDMNGGAIGTGEWVRLGASVGGGGGISAVRGGFGINVNDSAQPSRPMVFVDSDDLATKFVRIETYADDAKNLFFMMNKSGTDKNMMTSPTVFHVMGGTSRLTIKDNSSGGNSEFFDVRNRNGDILFQVCGDNRVRREASVAGTATGDGDFVDKKYADEHYVSLTGGNSSSGPNGVMTGSLTIDGANLFVKKKSDGTNLLQVNATNESMVLNGNMTGEEVRASTKLESLKVSSGQKSNLQLQWDDQTRMYIGDTLITNSVATQINNGPLSVYGNNNNVEAKMLLTGSKETTSSGAAASIGFSTRKGSETGYISWRENAEGSLFRFTHEVEFLRHIDLTGSSAANKVIQVGGTTRINFSDAGATKIPRTVADAASGNGFVLEGTDETGTQYPNGVLRVYHNNQTTADAVNYYGKSDSPSNLANRSQIDDMIDDGIASTVDKNYIQNTGQITSLITSTVNKSYIRTTGDISGLITSTVNKNYIRNTGDISGLITSTVDQTYIRNTGNISSLITNTVDAPYIMARYTPPLGRPFQYKGTAANNTAVGGFTYNNGTTNAGNAYITFSVVDGNGDGIPKIAYTTTPAKDGKTDTYFPITITNSGGDIHMHGMIRAFVRVDINATGLRTNRAYFWSPDNMQFWNNGGPTVGFQLGQTYYFTIGGMC